MSRLCAVAFLAGGLAALSGCVERLISVRTDPPESDVFIDDQFVGKSPCEVPYTWYGTRIVVVEKKGFRSLRERLVLTPPWWQFTPLDFLTDVVIPFTIRDRAEFAFTLEKETASEQELDEVRRRAAELREKAGVLREP